MTSDKIDGARRRTDDDEDGNEVRLLLFGAWTRDVGPIGSWRRLWFLFEGEEEKQRLVSGLQHRLAARERERERAEADGARQEADKK
jgi:hypothetical protein